MITFYPKSIEKTKHVFMTINIFWMNIFASQIVITVMFYSSFFSIILNYFNMVYLNLFYSVFFIIIKSP